MDIITSTGDLITLSVMLVATGVVGGFIFTMFALDAGWIKGDKKWKT